MKTAQDVTERKRATAETASQLAAVRRTQAVIEFDIDGTILDANANFLGAVGYGLEEIVGKHHRMFCRASFTSTPEYAAFWKKLASGEMHEGEYERVHKSGESVWIQASYHPILDESGRPFKVVKFATDTTARHALVQRCHSLRSDLDAAQQGLVSAADLMAERASVTTERAEHMAAAVAEVDDDVRSIADSSQELAQGITSVAGNADRAVATVEEAVASARTSADVLRALDRSSKEIGAVVETIASIANQTNLLALNAAVEAARAGHAGRGFAVVADEVKALADRTSDATKEIGLTIQTVQRGTSEAARSMMQLSDLVEGIRSVQSEIRRVALAQQAETNAIAARTETVTSACVELASEAKHVLAAARGTASGVQQTRGAATNIGAYASEMGTLLEDA